MRGAPSTDLKVAVDGILIKINKDFRLALGESKVESADREGRYVVINKVMINWRRNGMERNDEKTGGNGQKRIYYWKSGNFLFSLSGVHFPWKNVLIKMHYILGNPLYSQFYISLVLWFYKILTLYIKNLYIKFEHATWISWPNQLCGCNVELDVENESEGRLVINKLGINLELDESGKAKYWTSKYLKIEKKNRLAFAKFVLYWKMF